MTTDIGDGPSLFGIDDQYLYYAQTESGAVGFIRAARISKSATNSVGTPLVGGQYYATYNGPISGKLVWTSTPYMSSNTVAYQCDVSNCTAPTTSWLTGIGFPIHFNSVAPTRFSTIEPCDFATCIHWWDESGSTAKTYTYTTIQKDQPSALAAGDYVYWLSKNLDSGGSFINASLYSVNYSTLSKAQLAGGITQTAYIIDVNAQSVLLYDSGPGNLLRVPLPLGLGTTAPQVVTSMTFTSSFPPATEDASALYWIDGEGTVSKCTPSACSATTQILAVGQNTPSRLFQDSAALYWDHSNPDSIERLAK